MVPKLAAELHRILRDACYLIAVVRLERAFQLIPVSRVTGDTASRSAWHTGFQAVGRVSRMRL